MDLKNPKLEDFARAGGITPLTHPTSPGWTDQRLSQAYDLLDAVRAEHHPDTDAHHFLTIARDAVEDADVDLERMGK